MGDLDWLWPRTKRVTAAHGSSRQQCLHALFTDRSSGDQALCHTHFQPPHHGSYEGGRVLLQLNPFVEGGQKSDSETVLHV